MNDDKTAFDDIPEPEDARELKLLAVLMREATAEERREVEAWLEEDPALAKRMEELSFAATCMEDSLNQVPFDLGEVAPSRLSSDRRERVFAAIRKSEESPWLRLLGHPVAGVAVAACFMVVVLLSQMFPVFEARYYEHASLETEAPPPPPLDDDDSAAPQMEKLRLRVPMKQTAYPEEDRASSLKDVEFQLEGRSSASSDVQGIPERARHERADMLVYDLDGAEAMLADKAPPSYSPPEPQPDRRRIEKSLKASAPLATKELSLAVPLSVEVSDTSLAKRLAALDEAKAQRQAKAHEPSAQEELYVLSPFEVEAKDDIGYRAQSTVAGSRLNTQLRDLGRFYEAELSTLPFQSGAASETAANEPRRPSPIDTLSFGKSDSGELTGSVDAPESLDLSIGLISYDDFMARADEVPQLLNARIDASSHSVKADPIESAPAKSLANPSLIEYPEVVTANDPLSTFSLNVSDVSYKLAESFLAKRKLPPAGSLRTEEFINAFDYRDPVPDLDRKIGFNWERAHWPFAHNKEIVRFSVQAAATGRLPTQQLNVVLVVDNSGSMARPDRLETQAALINTIGSKLTPQDRISVVGFNRETWLLADGVRWTGEAPLASVVDRLTPQGGTDLEAGLKAAYETAKNNYLPGAINRVVLVTDGVANLGDTEVESLRKMVEYNRQQGIALDCLGIGLEDYDDAFLESLSRNGDGRYHFLSHAGEAGDAFGERLMGMLRPAAKDVKVQVEFNANRVKNYQQLGYQQHQLKDEDFRNNAVDAAELAAAESGNALYLIEVDENGSGEIGTLRVRYRDTESGAYKELSWNLAYGRDALPLEEASPSLRLAATSAGFAALLNGSALADGLTYSQLQSLSADLPGAFPTQARVQELPELLMRASSISGRE